MIEEIILIKQFIQNAPASQDEHDKVLNLFLKVTQHYQQQIQHLTEEVEKLKEKEDAKQ